MYLTTLEEFSLHRFFYTIFKKLKIKNCGKSPV